MRSRGKWWKISLLFVLSVVLLLVRYKGVFYIGVHPVVMYVESQRITQRTADYDIIEHDNFVIHHDEDDARAAYLLMSIADSWALQVLDFFRYQPSSSIDIILFSNEEDLKGVLRIPQGQSAIGAYAGGMINLLSPDSQEGMDESTDPMANVFVHELAHLVLDEICKGNYPLWFTEGSALYLEYVLLDYEWGSGLAERPNYTMEELTYRFSNLDDHMAYRQSFLLVKGLIQEYGQDSYLEFLHHLGQGAKFETAMKDVFGITKQDLEAFITD